MAYRGISISSFDGVLDITDGLPVIILTAGGISLQCTINCKVNADSWGKRSLIHGIAHYSFESTLPIHVYVIKVDAIKDNKDGLDKWRGAFKGD